MKKEHIVVISLAILAFCIRYYPHAFVMDSVGKEEGGLIMYAWRISEGDYRYINNLPHASIIGVAVIHVLTGISIPTCAFLWSPLMAGLSTVVLYFILRDVLKTESPWMGALLFATLDSNIYRTTLFGASSEATGILILLLFTYSYFKINELLALILLCSLLWVHIIVFGVGLMFLVVDQLFMKSYGKLKKLVLIGGLFVLACVGFYYFLPYRIAVKDITIQFATSSIGQLTNLMITRDIPILGSTLLGTFLLTVLIIYRFLRYKSRDFTSYVSICLIIIMTGFWIMSSSHISPYRILVYIGITGIMSFSLLLPHLRGLGTILTLVLSSLMIFQVAFCGWEVNNHIYYGVTSEEVAMVEWLIAYEPSTAHCNVLWDDMGKQLLLYKMPLDYYNPVEYTEKKKEEWSDLMTFKEKLANGTLTVNPDDFVNNTDSIPHPDDFVNNTDSTPQTGRTFTNIMSFVIYSDRFANRAFISTRTENGQVLYMCYPIEDIWANTTIWKLIYDDVGGKIYERIRG